MLEGGPNRAERAILAGASALQRLGLQHAEKIGLLESPTDRAVDLPRSVPEARAWVVLQLRHQRRGVEPQGVFRAIDNRPRVVHLPRWTLRVALAVKRLFSQARYGVLSFISHVQTEDTTAPTVGTRTFEQFLHDHAAPRSEEGA